MISYEQALFEVMAQPRRVYSGHTVTYCLHGHKYQADLVRDWAGRLVIYDCGLHYWSVADWLLGKFGKKLTT